VPESQFPQHKGGNKDRDDQWEKGQINMGFFPLTFLKKISIKGL
jgi:hypothetical protein